jgi:hypothetical protein
MRRFLLFIKTKAREKAGFFEPGFLVYFLSVRELIVD